MNLDEIKRRKIEELQKSIARQQEPYLNINEQLEMQQQVLFLENIAKPYLGRDALERYFNLKSAHPEFAVKIIAMIAQLVQTNSLNEQLDDEEFRMILQKIQEQKREFKIKRK